MRHFRILLLFGLMGSLGGCESTALLDDILQASQQNQGLTNQTIANGLREALNVGSGRVVDSLGRSGGFADTSFRIPLPEQLQKAKAVASRFGLSGPLDDLENRMNKAAEAAVPQARVLFLDAIKAMTFEDVLAIYRGGDDAATQYLKSKTTASLDSKMRPIISKNLQDVGAVQILSNVLKQYNAIPLVKPIDPDLNGHVSHYATEAIFVQLAEEEAAIRRDPVKRTTALLKRVFG